MRRRSGRTIVFCALWILSAICQLPVATALAAEPTDDVADCGSGVVKDDGDPESGYGFVPTATEGIYLQRFDASEFPRPQLKTVCVCLLKTAGSDEAWFNVVFYEDAGGRPAPEPYAAVAGQARELPRTKETAGRFYAVDVSGVVLPPGPSYIGVRWNPSKAKYAFVCNDQSETTEKVDVFFTEDRMPGWAHVDQSRDPIFRPHRSILVRAVAATAEEAATMKPRFVKAAASSTPRIER